MYIQDRPEPVCQRRSEVVDFSGVLEAILKRLEIVVYLSSRQVKFGPILPPSARSADFFQRITHFSYESLQKKAARAARKRFVYIYCLISQEGPFVMIQAARSAEFVLEIVYLSACLRTSRSHPETVENSCLLVYEFSKPS